MEKLCLKMKVKVNVRVTQLCLIFCNPMDYTVHWILQARILEWVAFPFSRGSSQPRDRTQVSHIAGGFFTSWVTREALGRIKRLWNRKKQLLGVQSRVSLMVIYTFHCLWAISQFCRWWRIYSNAYSSLAFRAKSRYIKNENFLKRLCGAGRGGAGERF